MSLRRASRTRWMRRLLALGLVLAAAAVGSARLGPWPLAAPAPAGPATAGETFALLRECHQRRAYGAMRPHLHPSGREGIIDLLIGVDELSVANSAVLTAMARACPGMETGRYDLAGVIQGRLELFSNAVELVEVQEKGDGAAVTVQIARRLPLERLAFERHDGVWQYLPGPENPAVLNTIRQMSRALAQIERVLGSGEWNPQKVDREFQVRIRPKLRVLRHHASAPPPARTQPAGSP